jgi:hypothetical protein
LHCQLSSAAAWQQLQSWLLLLALFWLATFGEEHLFSLPFESFFPAKDRVLKKLAK